MGNDGGSIPKRRELVKEAARAPTASEQKATALESLSHAWTHCALTGETLDAATTVSDWRGRLYNYEAVLLCLAGEESAPVAEFARTGIRSTRDVVKLKFTLQQRREDGKEKEFRACPVSMKELGPATKAVYVVPCGHVFADVAMKELSATPTTTTTTTTEEEQKQQEQKTCPECSSPFEARDIVPVLPSTDSEVERCTKRLEALKTLGLTHNLKKDKSNSDKKQKKRKAGADEANPEKPKKVASEKDKEKDISSRINNSMTASLTAKVLAEQEERNKRRKMVDAYNKRSEAVR
ncbi:DUF602-domain-containing protein [Xylariomycetidae sp. FL0641]|nr:DUF602-domain-containing protein [Xylariomycetidae sp. FL0641]